MTLACLVGWQKAVPLTCPCCCSHHTHKRSVADGQVLAIIMLIGYSFLTLLRQRRASACCCPYLFLLNRHLWAMILSFWRPLGSAACNKLAFFSPLKAAINLVWEIEDETVPFVVFSFSMRRKFIAQIAGSMTWWMDVYWDMGCFKFLKLFAMCHSINLREGILVLCRGFKWVINKTKSNHAPNSIRRENFKLVWNQLPKALRIIAAAAAHHDSYI